ncbi:hypothetical protein [Vallitalea maricola]|uniref:Uncharacterized protein n=1 Tax=Vallitalea maricola TaxID=3074433 RepID=A0ACB5UJE4_9FIRM|nr:hypothetical protein AN2V17_21130 [Vallitalea sp. AN17-2]
MENTKYNLKDLSKKEDDIIKLAERADYIFNKFKIISNSIDTDIVRRDNINNELNSLLNEFQNLIEHTYNTSKIINEAITEYSNGEKQIQNLLNGLLEINTNSVGTAVKHSKEDAISGFSILHKWFKDICNQLTSSIKHLKDFFDNNGTRINNQPIFKWLGHSIEDYQSYFADRIKQIQQYISGKGINIDITGIVDKATFQALRMIGFDNLKDNGLITNSFDALSLNIYDYFNDFPAFFDDYTVKPPEWILTKVENAVSVLDHIPDVTRETVYFFKDTYPYSIPYQAFTYATQNGWFPEAFDLAGFERIDGIYHAKQDALLQSQKYVGYNAIYDYVFDCATSMDTKIFDFTCDNNEEYRLWFWKGDYLNLGAGAEVGIYYGGGPHWLIDKDLALPMTLSLKDRNNKKIFDWKPEDDNWWITGFNPDIQNIKADDLTVKATIDFSDNPDMWKSFYNIHQDNSMWTFYQDSMRAEYKWEAKPLERRKND